jgi:hypothetical protein
MASCGVFVYCHELLLDFSARGLIALVIVVVLLRGSAAAEVVERRLISRDSATAVYLGYLLSSYSTPKC